MLELKRRLARRKEARRQRLKKSFDEVNDGRIRNHPVRNHSRPARYDDAEEEENDSNFYQIKSHNHNIKKSSEQNLSYDDSHAPDHLDSNLNNNLNSIPRLSRNGRSESESDGSSIELSVKPSKKHSKVIDKNESDSESVVHIELIYCENCERSTAPATHERFCKTLNANGIPKCVAMRSKKRKVYNAAKVRGSSCVVSSCSQTSVTF